MTAILIVAVRNNRPVGHAIACLLIFFFAALAAPSVRAEVSGTNIDANALLQRVLTHHGARDFSLKARLFVERNEPIPVEMLVHNTPEETRTIYHVAKTELLVVQPVNGDTHWFLKGAGELTGARRMETLAGSQFTYYDLGLPFLHWPGPKVTGEGRVRGQDCYMLEVTATNQPYGLVKLWIEEKYAVLLRAEVYTPNEALVRRLAITSFKRLGDLWLPRGIEVAFVNAQQALPSEEKSRLEIDEGNYETKLSPELFSEDNSDRHLVADKRIEIVGGPLERRQWVKQEGE